MSSWGGSTELMDRPTIVRTGLLFGAISGGFALAVHLGSFFTLGDENLLTITAGLTLQVLIIGEAGRVMGLASGRLSGGVWTGAIAGGLSEALSHSLARAAFPYTPAGRAAFHALTPAQWAQVTDPQYIALNLVASVVSLIVLGALYGGLGAWAEVRAKQ